MKTIALVDDRKELSSEMEVKAPDFYIYSDRVELGAEIEFDKLVNFSAIGKDKDLSSSV